MTPAAILLTCTDCVSGTSMPFRTMRLRTRLSATQIHAGVTLPHVATSRFPTFLAHGLGHRLGVWGSRFEQRRGRPNRIYFHCSKARLNKKTYIESLSWSIHLRKRDFWNANQPDKYTFFVFITSIILIILRSDILWYILLQSHANTSRSSKWNQLFDDQFWHGVYTLC